MDTIWAYCRVSTSKEEQEESLEAQETWARAFAAEIGACIRIFREQASAKTTIGRPIFQAMMSELGQLPKNKRPTHLAVTALDRLSRSLRDTLNVVETLREYRVLLYQRGLGVIATETFPEKAALAGLSLAGEAENYGRSVRGKQSWERRRTQGKPTSNKPPYGLQVQGEWDIPTPDSALWVENAFRWYDAGDGLHTIARRFAAGAPVHAWLTARVGPDGERIRKTRTATKWETSIISRLLKQGRYRGTIIDPGLFDRVQDRLRQMPHPNSRRVREYPLSGALRCGGCGRRLRGRASGGNRAYRVVSGEVRWSKSSHRTRYYACSVCDYALNADVLEARFFKDISSLAADDGLLQRWVAGDQEQSASRAHRSEIRRLEHECSTAAYHQKVDRAMDLAIAGGLSELELRRQIDRIKAEFALKQKRLNELSAVMAANDHVSRSLTKANDLISKFETIFEFANYETKCALVHDLVEALGGITTSPLGLKWVEAQRKQVCRRLRKSQPDSVESSRRKNADRKKCS